jgi:TRAP-type mannitol/chloroaromatic compound transport system permease small subunit
MVVTVVWLSLPLIAESYKISEMSANAGGLIRWPVKVLLPIGFTLLALQGISELIKRLAFLTGACDDPNAKEKARRLKKNWPPPSLPPKPRRQNNG